MHACACVLCLYDMYVQDTIYVMCVFAYCNTEKLSKDRVPVKNEKRYPNLVNRGQSKEHKET